MKVHPLIKKFVEVREERMNTYSQLQIDKFNDFDQLATMWTAIIAAKHTQCDQLDAHTVCLMMAALKLWRAARAPSLEDSYIDAMNYIVLAKECLDASEHLRGGNDGQS